MTEPDDILLWSARKGNLKMTREVNPDKVGAVLLEICKRGLIALDRAGLGMAKNEVWDQQILGPICDKGEGLGHQVRCKRLRPPEFLWDVTWQKNDGGLALALESEWDESPEAIMYDFRKLCFALADLRCVIFQGSGTAIVEKTFDALEAEAKRHSIPHYPMRYVLLGFIIPSRPVNSGIERLWLKCCAPHAHAS